jgi:AMP-polyphosphate phosphotransferase
MLESVDLSLALTKTDYERELRELQSQLVPLQIELAERRKPIIIVYEGWDAAGKGGNIKRLTERLDPRFFTVYGIGKPTQDELDHHYLWRFWNRLPARDHLVIFDRSWYGRVLVERIEGFATEQEWQRAYAEINDFEKLLIDDGAVIVKFWLHISADEQLHRFERRLADPAKRWKMNEEDWRNRAKWSQYEIAIEDMLQKTNPAIAPWVLIEGNDKRWARIKALRTVVERFRAELGITDDAAEELAPDIDHPALRTGKSGR